jgi:hypothetical protein
MSQIYTENLNVIARHLLNADTLETFRCVDKNGYDVHVKWHIPHIDLLKAETPYAGFQDLFTNMLEPLADLMRLTSKPLIEQLRKELAEAKEQIASDKNELKMLRRDFEFYKQAVKDVK